MNENYVDSVRESLYIKKEKKQNMPKSSKKIIFATSEYKSESVFSSPEQFKQKNATSSEKSKKKQRIIAPVSSDEYLQPKRKLSSKFEKRKQPKRSRKISKELDSFRDEEKHASRDISPSKSERFENHTTPTIPKNIKEELESPESDEEDNESYTWSDLFDTCEHSLNESITEAHSGIDYEFISNGIENVEIINSRIYDPCKEEPETLTKSSDEETQSGDESDHSELEQETMDTEEDNLVVSEDNSIPSKESVNENIALKLVETEKAAETYEVSNQILVVMGREECLPFFGLFTIEVLLGKIEILGCELDKTSKEISIFSPRGSSILSVKNITSSQKVGRLWQLLPSLKGVNCLKDVNIETTTAVFVCKKINDPKITFLERYISQQIFPKTDKTELPQVIFNPKGDWNVVTESSEWNRILKRVTTSTKLLVTGGKGVGKSTFIKYAINRLLKKHGRIRLVDLDPGQPEFTIPGSVSYLTVTEPVLGPNYSHLRQTDKSYLCDINIRYDVNGYLRNVKVLMEEVDALESLPTIINYIGLTRDIGLKIVSSAITHIRPTDVVQIDSKSRKRNFETNLTPKTVGENCGSYTDDGRLGDLQLTYRFHQVPAMTDNNGGWTLQPRQVREMCVLAYMGGMMKGDVQALTDWRLPAYQINLSSIDITDPTGSPLPAAALSASLVALCKDLTVCLGYGFVRGVDPVDSYLVLLTPMEPDALEEVRHLVGGLGVALPPSVYMTPDGAVLGHVPYVMPGELTALGQITKRSYVPAKK